MSPCLYGRERERESINSGLLFSALGLADDVKKNSDEINVSFIAYSITNDKFILLLSILDVKSNYKDG